MRLFFSALVLNFMVFSKKIEAAGSGRIKTRTSRNDPEGVDTHLLAQQASDLGGHQYYFPQFSYSQNHGYHPHPQEYLHQGSSTEASGLRRVSTMPYQNFPLGIDHLATSRLRLQSSSTHDHISRGMDALDLYAPSSFSPEPFDPQSHEYHSYPQESFYPLNPEEISHLVNKHNFKNGRLPDSINDQEPDDSQENARLHNVEWLVGQTREAELQALYEQYKDEEASALVHDGSFRKSKNMLNKKQRPAKQLKEEMVQEERPKKPRQLRIREPVSSQNNIEESAMNPHATEETRRRGKGKAASRKGVSDSRFKAEAEARKNVLVSHDPFIQQSQSSEHYSNNVYPFSIPSHMSAFNHYRRLPSNDPNDAEHWNPPGASGSGYQK